MSVLRVDFVVEFLHFAVGTLPFDIVVPLCPLLTPVVVVIGVSVSCSSSEGCGALL